MPLFIHRSAIALAACSMPLCIAGAVHAQATSITYNFIGQGGNQASQSVVTQPLTAVVSDLTRAPFNATTRVGLTIDQNDTQNSFKATDYVPGSNQNPSTFQQAFDQNDYLTFTVTPTGGNSFSIFEFSVSGRRLGQGPSQLVFRSSRDNFASNITPVLTIAASPTKGPATILPVSGITNVSATTEFRLYGYDAGSNAATGGIILDDFFGANGAFVVIPESSTALSVGLGGLVGLMGVGVRRMRSRRK